VATFSLWYLLIAIGVIGGGVVLGLGIHQHFKPGSRKESSIASADIERLIGAADIETILHAYEHVRGREVLVNRHIRELPYDKETIRKAIKLALLIEADENKQNELAEAYSELAFFQDPELCLARGISIHDAAFEEFEHLTEEVRTEANRKAITEVHRNAIDYVNEQASKATILGWWAGLGWYAYSHGGGDLHVFVWLILIFGGMAVASTVITGAVATLLSFLTWLVYGDADATTAIVGWGGLISPIIAFFCAPLIIGAVKSLLTWIGTM
jgi:hypothetical protein